VGSNPTLSAITLAIVNCQSPIVDFFDAAVTRSIEWQLGNCSEDFDMSDNKLANDEERRSVQHGSVKAQVEGEVNAEIAEQAAVSAPKEEHKIEQVAGEFRAKAVDEVVSTEREVERGRGAARVSQIIDYIFFIVYGLLGMRFLLNLLAANPSAGFAKFIVAITNPFYAPFRGIVNVPQTEEGNKLMLPIVVAIIAYVMLHLIINGLLRMVAHRKTEI
jgi:uncharacterized protein YggT (Ycf19 family)